LRRHVSGWSFSKRQPRRQPNDQSFNEALTLAAQRGSDQTAMDQQ
jgi:hypothetical protein